MPLAGIATALPLLGGWPFTTFSLPLLIGLGLVTAVAGGRDLRRLAPVAAAAVLGAGLAMPAILPTAAYMAESARSPVSNLWRAELPGLLSFGFPSFATQWLSWDGQPRLIDTPFFYLGWFCPIVLAHVRWRAVTSWQGQVLLAVTLVFGILCMAPAAWYLRWAFRFLPVFHFGLALLTAWALGRAEGETWSWGRTAVAVGGPFVLALLNAPALVSTHLAFLGGIALLVLLVRSAQRHGRSIGPVLLGGQAVILVVMILLHPSNDAIPRWQPPTSRLDTAAAPQPRELALFSPLSGLEDRTADFWTELPAGNRGLQLGRSTVNGYSPVLIAGLYNAFCFNHIGATCPQLPAFLFAPDRVTGLPLLDLVKVGRVTAERGAFADAFRAAAGAGWATEHVGSAAEVFVRSSALPAKPGSVSWSSPGIDLALVAANTRRETYDVVTTPGSPGGDVVLARPWYPGMVARLNGRELPLQAYRRMLPLIELPAGASGRLVIEYWPAGLSSGLIMAAASAAILIVLGLAARRRSLPLARLGSPAVAGP